MGKLDKELEKEGLTQEVLDSVNMKKDFSPVQLGTGEIVKLLACSKGFWISREEGKYEKQNGQYVVMPEPEARIARARYVLNHQEEINRKKQQDLDDKIEDEINRLKNQVDQKVGRILRNMRETLVHAGILEADAFDKALIMGLQSRSPYLSGPISVDHWAVAQENAKKRLEENPDLLDSYNSLKKLKDEKAYDELYVLLFQEGLPLLGSFSMSDMDTVKKYFSKDALTETVDKLNTEGHLAMVARLNIEKLEAQKK